MHTELRRLEQDLSQISSNNISASHNETCVLDTGSANLDFKFKLDFDRSVSLREFLTQSDLITLVNY